MPTSEEFPTVPTRTGDDKIRVRANGRPAFSQVPKALTEDLNISATAYRLWVLLEGYTYRDEVTVEAPTRQELADKLGKKVRALAMALAELVDAGWITVSRKWYRDGGQAPNSYMLEWTRVIPVVAGHPHPESPVSAGQEWVQKIAPMKPAPETVHVSAGQEWEQKIAPMSAEIDMGAKICTGGVQKNALIYRNNKNHQEENHHQATTGGDPDGPLVVVDGSPAQDSRSEPPIDVLLPAAGVAVAPSTAPANVRVLVDAVLDALPLPLARSVSRVSLRRACIPLDEVGWTPKLLADLVKGRSWTGANNPGGVLITWLKDLAEEPPMPARRPGPVGSVWPTWCGTCDGEKPAQRTIVEVDRVVPCPRCNPKSARYPPPGQVGRVGT